MTTEFPEGAHWHTYNRNGIAECSDMVFRLAEDGDDLTGVVKNRGPEPEYLAISLVTGGLLKCTGDFKEALTAAEAEALNPTYP